MCSFTTPNTHTYEFQLRIERNWICDVKGLVRHSSDSKYVGKGDLLLDGRSI